VPRQGAPIIFVYGIGCLINHWQHQINIFFTEYQTIVFDFRSHHKVMCRWIHSNISIDALRVTSRADAAFGLDKASFLRSFIRHAGDFTCL